MTITFGTREAAKELGRAGFNDPQIEALVNVARRTTALPDISNLATKMDVQSAISELRADMRAEIATAKLQAITILSPGIAAIVAIITFGSRLIH
jgi:hypothetical protein